MVAVCVARCGAVVMIADFETAESNRLDAALRLGQEPFVDDAERAIYAALSRENERIRVDFSEEFASLGRRALRCSFGRSFRTGFSLSFPEIDFTPYDRLCVDVVNSAQEEDQMDLQVASAGEKLDDSIYRVDGMRRTFRAPPGKSVWTLELNRWPKRTDRTRIAKLNFFALHPFGATLHFDRIRLLKKGERDTPAVYSAADERKIAGIVRRSAELAAGRRRETMGKFRDRCAAVGVRQPLNVLVGTATSMDRILPMSPFAFDTVRPPNGVDIRLARGECEGFQVVVCPLDGPHEDVSVNCVGFKPGFVTCSVLGYSETKFQAPYAVGRTIIDGEEPGNYHRTASFLRPGWYPDPILSHVRATRVAKDVAQGFWVRVACPRDVRKGVFRGEVVVSVQRRERLRIPLAVRVNGFKLPLVSPMPIAMNFNPKGGIGWMPTDAEHEERTKAKADPAAPCQIWKNRKIEWADFLADYLIPYDFIYRLGRDEETKYPDYEILDRLNRQGRLGPVSIAYWGGLRDDEKSQRYWLEKDLPYYRSIYEKYKQLGIADRCYFYGNDEVNPDYFPAVRRSAAAIHEAFPGVPLLTTARDRDFGIGTNSLGNVDWFCPLTGRYDFERAEKARAQGKKVWWYVCDGPTWCHANMHIENKPIDTRLLLGALSARYKADGFLYWQVGKWLGPRPIGRDPFTEWVAASCFGFNGEGCLAAVGPDGIPLPTVRLENFRDGLEDLAYVSILKRCLAAGAGNGLDDALTRRARELVAVPVTLVKTLGNFADDPETLYAWRDEMADVIERLHERKKNKDGGH